MADNFIVQDDLGVLGEKGDKDIHLAKVSWYGREAKYDIRPWDWNMSTPGKGISLSYDEAYELYNLLKEEFDD